MRNQITNLEIQNFKSIKQLQASCKRINLFIGKPNVGKSNILEAISLLGAPYERNEKKYLSSFIRYEDLSNLFYDQNLQHKIQISTNIGFAQLRYHFSSIDAYDIILGPESRIFIDFNLSNLDDIQNAFSKYSNDIIANSILSKPISPFYKIINNDSTLRTRSENGEQNPLKKYDFKIKKKFDNKFPAFLLPPHGNNLFTIIHNNKIFYKELTSLFKEYGLELVLRIKDQQFEIQKNIDGIIYSYPYSTIADTLQRVIFYLTAIESNTDSVLLFEEPEAHAFPPYTRMLADRIVHSQQNQFFITTHSPYLLHTIIENTPIEDLNVFVTYFEDYQTKVKALSSEEIRDVLDDSIDIFFNLDRFVAHEA